MKENILKLKPCKFCGGKAKFARTVEDLTVFSSSITDTPYRISVYCSDCNQTLSYAKDIDGREKVKTRLFTSFGEATLAWNAYNDCSDFEDGIIPCLKNRGPLTPYTTLLSDEYPIDNENKT